MTVEYSVLWEEYLELCKPYFLRPDWASSIAGVLIAIALVIVAIAVDWAGRRNGPTPAVMLVLIAIALIGTALWAPTAGTLISRWRYKKKCRSAYEEHFGEKQQHFVFDDEKWVNRTRPDDGEVLWGDTTSSAEYEHVILVQSAKSFALLPKRALSAETLNQLRHLAFGTFNAPMKFRVGLREYLQTEIRSLWRRRTSGMVLAHGAGVLVSAAMVGSLRTHHHPDDAFWGVLLSASLLLITLSTQFLYFLAKYATDWSRVHVAWEMECSDRGAHVRTGTTEYFSSWSVFPKVEETRRAFLLYSDADRYYILPMSSLTPEQQNELRKVLIAKLKTA